jgi:hypothetical protein
LKQNTYVYDYEKDEKELQAFIKNNVAKATTTSKLKIDKNNFIPIYLRWLEIVKPIIDVNWDELKKANILDSDFFLADLFVDDKDTQNIEDDLSIRDNLFVVFQNEGYKIAKENLKQMFDATITLKNKDTYLHFWKRYKRPPLKEFQDYIIERRDLLVPQDIRERKGAFFTPRIWVELSQKYLTDYLGENWQDEYYIWDCAAGTGNLLAGLTNKYNIYASTLDQADVNVMHERIDHGANLLKGNVFQFDFLNDDFTKLPQSLQDIINDEEKRKKLVIYINPPYAEHGNRSVHAGNGEHKTSVSNTTNVYNEFNKTVGTSVRELYVQFFLRIYKNIPNSILASFSTLKFISSPNFSSFRNYFKVNFQKGFICKASSFDNVKGKFPIGFLIWELDNSKSINEITVDVFEEDLTYIGNKCFFVVENDKYLINWFRPFIDRNVNQLGSLHIHSNDVQQQNVISISSEPTKSDLIQKTFTYITSKNLIAVSIYYALRHHITATWINNRDQFLFPNEGWQTDAEFQNDCFAFTLFNNNIQSQFGTNHWIPFTEYEVDAQAKFESNFMTDFMKGKIKQEVTTTDLFSTSCQPEHTTCQPELVSGSTEMLKQVQHDKGLVFSPEATAVFDAGRELWKYYHAQKDVNVNASLYDIREYFQGRNDKGRMNSKSDDATYTKLIAELRSKLAILADKIKPKVYEYGFLKL